MFVSSIYLLKKRAGKPNTHGMVRIFRHTNCTLRHGERSEATAAFNPLRAAIRPKCDSSPLFLFRFNFYFYSPLHSHCDSKGRAYLKLTPAPWYPLRIPTRYYSLPGMGSATWRTSTMSAVEMLSRRETPPWIRPRPFQSRRHFSAQTVFLHPRRAVTWLHQIRIR